MGSTAKTTSWGIQARNYDVPFWSTNPGENRKKEGRRTKNICLKPRTTPKEYVAKYQTKIKLEQGIRWGRPTILTSLKKRMNIRSGRVGQERKWAKEKTENQGGRELGGKFLRSTRERKREKGKRERKSTPPRGKGQNSKRRRWTKIDPERLGRRGG